jgi:hypothetical protein
MKRTARSLQRKRSESDEVKRESQERSPGLINDELVAWNGMHSHTGPEITG